MKRKCALVLLILGLLSPGMAAALGLGELTLKSYLNEPLVAEVKLLEIGDLDPSQIRVRLATREDFSRAGVERAYFLTSLRFEVVGTPDGGALLQIRSSDPVREPYLDFIVEARWPTGRLLREYTILLDPPIFVGDESGITARATASQQRRAGRPTGGGAAQAAQQARQPASRPRPQREYDSQATDRPRSGEQYLVKRDDTLWKIADAGRPSGASVHQTMLDIQRMNPEAFMGGNINRLKAGYILRMPTSGDITPQSFEEAVREVERQTQRWQSGVSDVDRMDASEGLDVSGMAGSDSGEGHLQIAGVDSSDDTPMAGDVSARMEDLDRTRRENVELGTRLSAMEEQMEMQERLISLKDEQIAALQEALDRAGGEVEMPAEAQEGAIQQSETPEEPAPEEPAVAEAPPQPEPQPAPKPVAPPPPPPEPTMLDMVMDNIIYVGAGLLFVLLVVLFLLRDKLGLGRGKKDQELPAANGAAGSEDDFADVSLSEDSLLVDEFDEEPEEIETEEETPEASSSSYSSTDEQYAAQFESGDALAEADIYIAYGRFPQAVDLLKAAIAVEPINTDYRIKLMEACVEMVESGEFQQQYADLQVINDENVLQRARSLLEAVDGGDVWLDDLPEPSITAAEVDAARAGMSGGGAGAESPELPEPAELEESLDLGIDVDADLDTDLDEITSDEDETGLDLDEDALTELDEDATEDSLELEVDFDDDSAGLELDEELVDEGTDTELDTEDADLGLELGSDDSADSDDDTGIDFDIEADADEAPEFEQAEEAVELDGVAIEGEEEELSPDEAAELDSLSLDTGFEAEVESADTDSDEEGDDDLLADLGDLGADLGGDDETVEDLEKMSLSLDDSDDSDLAELGAELESGDDAADPGADVGSDLDLVGDSDLDMDSELDGVEFDLSGDADDGDLADMELDISSDGGDDEGLMFAANGDEIATKLDLARAYIDMGDHDGARSILEEVMEGGSEAQQGEARELLEGID